MYAGLPRSWKIASGLAVIWLLSYGVCLAAIILVLLGIHGSWWLASDLLLRIVLGQTWVSIVACMGILLLSRQRHGDREHAWAHGALLIYVLAGLLTAIVWCYGLIPQFLQGSQTLLGQLRLLLVLLLHGLFALLTVVALWRHRRAD